MRFSQHFISSVIPETRYQGVELQNFQGASVDSRTLQKGEMFIAIPGANTDGHKFLAEAVQKGASSLMIAIQQESALKKIEASTLKNIAVILVPDTKDALVRLATAWRAFFNIPIIAITGSIGKTTTKEMLANIIRTHGLKCTVSQGNQNTTVGVALNVLRMKTEDQVGVFEMGISKRGEMARMAEIVKPTCGIITTIGHSHMEGLGSLADIAHEKRDIFKFFKPENIGIINGDLPLLATISYTHPVIKFGFKTTNQVQGRKIQVHNQRTTFVLKLYKERLKITLETSHAGRVLNALACASAAYLLNIPSATIVAGIQKPLTIAGRYEHTKLKAAKGILINDCYNASPESMKAALLAFEKVEAKGEKIAVLGDMLELGVNTPFWHRQLGRLLRKVPSLHHVVLVGDHVKYTKATVPIGVTYEHVPSWKEAVDVLKKRIDKESAILVKASFGMQLSNLVTELTEKSN